MKSRSEASETDHSRKPRSRCLTRTHLKTLTGGKLGEPDHTGIHGSSVTAFRKAVIPMAPPWTVRAWPPLLWQADSTMDLRLIHMHTRVVQSGLHDTPCSGQTLWAFLYL